MIPYESPSDTSLLAVTRRGLPVLPETHGLGMPNVSGDTLAVPAS